MSHRTPSRHDLTPSTHRSDRHRSPQLGLGSQIRRQPIKISPTMCSVIARFSPAQFSSCSFSYRFFSYRFVRNAAPPKHLVANPREARQYRRRVQGPARRCDEASKILPRPSLMHDVCDGKVARRGQMDAVASRTYPCFIGPKMSTALAQESLRCAPKLYAARELPIYRTDIPTCLMPPVLPLALVGC